MILSDLILTGKKNIFGLVYSDDADMNDDVRARPKIHPSLCWVKASDLGCVKLRPQTDERATLPPGAHAWF